MLLKALAERSPTRSIASRFTSVSGLFYLGMGLAICAAPSLVPTLFFEPPFKGREAGLFRLIGWIMAVVSVHWPGLGQRQQHAVPLAQDLDS